MSGLVGQHLGSYRLTRLLGQGGFADVYLGEHLHLGMRAAIKVLRTRLLEKEQELFQKESRLIARLSHPNIIRVLDFNLAEDTPFLVMDYAPNGTLRKRFPKGELLAPLVVLPFVKQVAAALQYAHDQRLIHRDVKPENMLLGPNDAMWLSDFGIAVISQSAMYQSAQDVAGTVAYMAPEQIQAHARPASDQYSLGVVIYEWLAGERPFEGGYVEVATKHSIVPPPPLREKAPWLSSAVEQIVMTALAKDPKERFANLRAFAYAFEQACSDDLGLVSSFPGSPGVLPRVTKPVSTPLPPDVFTPGSPLVVPSSSFTPPPGTPLPDSLPRGTTSTPLEPLNVEEFSTQALPASNETHPAVSQQQSVRPRKLSRRVVVAGLAATVVVAGGGATAWFKLMQREAAAQAITLPTGALYIYRGHTRAVWSMAWSPDGARIASGSGDQTVQVWDALTGKHASTLEGHSDTVRAVAWSPDGLTIASGSHDHLVNLWNASSGDLALQYSGHSNWVLAVAWAPDTAYVASAGADHTAQVWDPTRGQKRYTYTNHLNYVQAVAWSPKGARIASGSADRTVQIWDALTGANTLIYNKHTDSINAVAWSPDGHSIASAGNDKIVRVWNAATLADVITYSNHTDIVNALAWSPDGKYLASGSSDHTVQVWEAATGALAFTYRGHASAVSFGVGWAPTGGIVASTSVDKTVQVWRPTVQ